MVMTGPGETEAESGSFVEIRGLEKRYGDSVALRDVDLDLRRGAITVVLGPSGCGKSTLLRILAGLTMPDGGRVVIDGSVVNDPRSRVPSEDRGVGMVFQDSMLWPHLTVRRNIAFALGGDRDGARKVLQAAESAAVTDFLDRYPSELSGGERRRVAIARAIVGEPRLLLLDEPLSGLDANLRVRMLDTIAGIQRSLGVTAAYVTHDQEEALGLGDEIVVLRDGRVLQKGSPEEVYRRPASAFVAGFVGVSTLVSGEASGGEVRSLVGRFPHAGETEGKVVLAVRPESVRTGGGSVSGEVVRSSFLGDRWLTCIRVSDQELLLYTAERREPGDEVAFELEPAPVPVAADEEAR
jgi:putative spermidine/putrescine transport system ATP-binding protein